MKVVEAYRLSRKSTRDAGELHLPTDTDYLVKSASLKKRLEQKMETRSLQYVSTSCSGELRYGSPDA